MHIALCGCLHPTTLCCVGGYYIHMAIIGLGEQDQGVVEEAGHAWLSPLICMPVSKGRSPQPPRMPRKTQVQAGPPGGRGRGGEGLSAPQVASPEINYPPTLSDTADTCPIIAVRDAFAISSCVCAQVGSYTRQS